MSGRGAGRATMITRARLRLAGGALVCGALAGAACGRDVPRVPVEETILQRQIDGLASLVAAAESGPLVPFDQVLVVVRQGLVQDLLTASLPFERLVDGRYRIRVEEAAVRFENGFALVRLDGQATFAQGMDQAASAHISLYGGLDVVELDATSGVLRGRVEILALDARRVDVLGLGAPVTRLVEELSRERLDAFAPVLSDLEIPVRMETELTIPALKEKGVTIEEARIPLQAGVQDVKAFHQRLWVSITASAAEKGAAVPRPRPRP